MKKPDNKPLKYRNGAYQSRESNPTTKEATSHCPIQCTMPPAALTESMESFSFARVLRKYMIKILNRLPARLYNILNRLPKVKALKRIRKRDKDRV